MSAAPEKLNLKLRIWRQAATDKPGAFENYEAKEISTEMSFLEMLDVVNQGLIKSGKEPIAFDHDCREGICGSCSMTINGNPHGSELGTTVCQLHMRKFHEGQTVVVEPFRAKAFPVRKDLVVDRTAMDAIIAAGGFIAVNTGSAPEANALPVPKVKADPAFAAAACIGCGACVAACANSSAMLFVGAKVSHLALLPQGSSEKNERVLAMMDAMEGAGFGNCSNTGACSLACPKEISFENIVRMNREFAKASLTRR